MGINANQYWQSSNNGKSMVIMLCRRRDADIPGSVPDVELVRDICDWLIAIHQKNLIADARAKGASEQQATLRANAIVGPLEAMCTSMGDRNCEANATNIIDACFQRYAGNPQTYAREQAQFADILRQRVKDDVEGDGQRDGGKNGEPMQWQQPKRLK